MKKMLTVLSAIVLLLFAANLAISLVEKFETHQARIARENTENREKVAALQRRAEAIRESNESDFEQAFRYAWKQSESQFPSPIPRP
jgi:hypothetical protein